MDTSKPFDRVNYYKLFSKLIDAGVNALIVRLIFFWYRSQTIFVSWNGCISRGFHATNGVRQGIVLSPLLFNMCTSVQGLRQRVNCCSRFGIKFDICFNHSKSACMYFLPFRVMRAGDVFLNDNVLSCINTYTYLGHIISCDLCDEPDIKQQLSRFYAREYSVVHKFRACNPSVKRLLF